MVNKNMYRIKWEKSPYNEDYFMLKITFKRDDGVKISEILDVLKTVNQEKLYKAFDNQGVQVLVNKGYLLGYIDKKTYENYIKGGK